jgi:hypothetical protein
VDIVLRSLSEEVTSILGERPEFQDDNDFLAITSSALIGLVNTYAS